jgi:hypothetical protein
MQSVKFQLWTDEPFSPSTASADQWKFNAGKKQHNHLALLHTFKKMPFSVKNWSQSITAIMSRAFIHKQATYLVTYTFRATKLVV